MRRLLGPAVALPLTVCISIEPDWVVTHTRFRGVKIDVVEPGPYGSLLNVPPGRHRATILPLDTVELEWFFAAPPGVEVPPPIWIICPGACAALDHTTIGTLPTAVSVALDDPGPCPVPLPLNINAPCRLGEGHRIRVSLGGAYTVGEEHLQLLVISSRHDGLTPATCLERFTTRPPAHLESCVIGVWLPSMGPKWATHPFDPATDAIPPEILEQEADTHPEVIGFTATRERGSERHDIVVALGDSVGVRSGETVSVRPLFAEGSAQQFWRFTDAKPDAPWSGTMYSDEEYLSLRALFSAFVDGFEPYGIGVDTPITFVVPADFAPTFLYLDVADNRSGHTFVELLLVPIDDA